MVDPCKLKFIGLVRTGRPELGEFVSILGGPSIVAIIIMINNCVPQVRLPDHGQEMVNNS